MNPQDSDRWQSEVLDDIDIAEARGALEKVVKLMIDNGVIPFKHPLPSP